MHLGGESCRGGDSEANWKGVSTMLVVSVNLLDDGLAT